MILLDTSVLSLVFRRRRKAAAPSAAVNLFRRLVEEDLALGIPGIVLQELLSGLRTEAEEARLEREVEGLTVITATPDDHRAAARISNSCRRVGLAAHTVDCLIAAQTLAARGHLFTLDEDFTRMAPCCGLKLVPLG